MCHRRYRRQAESSFGHGLKLSLPVPGFCWGLLSAVWMRVLLGALSRE